MNLSQNVRWLLSLVAGFLSFDSGLGSEGSYERVNLQAIDRVFAGNYVKFDFLSEGDHQFVGYYDANRQLTVAQREGVGPWKYFKLDSWYGWDSHNYIRMVVDGDGHLHVMANMHAEGLEYFRTSEPYRVRSLERIPSLGHPELEVYMTYPVFMDDKQGYLILKYRSGFSGNGFDVYKRYDLKTRSWSRLHDAPLLDGLGEMNAYSLGPNLGPDGNYHLIWVWRDTPDAATNHDLGYARSPDLVNWEYSDGRPLPLPITLDNSEIVDPIPAFGGALNGGNDLGFDSENRPVIVYFKFDDIGSTQIYLARKEGARWKVQQISDWVGFRWEFGGMGSLGEKLVSVGGISVLEDGLLSIGVKREGKSMRFIVKESNLETVRVEEVQESRGLPFPEIIATTASSDEVVLDSQLATADELVLRTLPSRGQSSRTNRFYLSWESQIPYRGQARDQMLEPSTLYLHELKEQEN